MNFTNLLEHLSTVISFGKKETYDENKHEIISCLNHDEINKLFTIFTNQPNFTNPIYSVYKQDNEMNFSYINDINNSKKKYNMIIDICDSQISHDSSCESIRSNGTARIILLDGFNIFYLATYLYENSNLRYIFLVADYSSPVYDSGHRSAIMIDNKEMTIQVLDPNGSNDYFNDMFNKEMDLEIENLLKNYFNELKKYGLNYKYIYSYEWNPEQLCINHDDKFTKYANNGHCSVLTIIIANLISVLQLKPISVYQMLNDLSKEELSYVVTSYTTGLSTLVE